MFEVNAVKNQLSITDREPITSGSVNVYQVHFHFTSHWDGLEKIAVFKTPDMTINIPIENNLAVVPWEVTTTPGYVIRLGVYGLKVREVVLPTIWTTLATVEEGVVIGDAESGDHTPDIYDTFLRKLEDLEKRIPNEDSLKEIVTEIVETSNKIKETIVEYLQNNPPEVPEDVLNNLVENYFEENPIETLNEEDVKQIIQNYLTENQVGVTEERVQEMIDATVGSAIRDGY